MTNETPRLPVTGSDVSGAIDRAIAIADRHIEAAISRASNMDKRGRDYAKEVAREYAARSIGNEIRKEFGRPQR